jgi:competence protein ComEC
MYHYSLLIVCLLACTFLLAQEPKQIKVYYFNVGQAASALVEFPCGAVLIDARAQDEKYTDTLIQDLKAFFARRIDLHNTVDVVFVTHDHIDYDFALKAIVEQFNITKYIDNGLFDGSGKNQSWLQQNAEDFGIEYSNYSVKDIEAHNNHKGYTDTIVDPIKCSEIDPKIILFFGREDTQPATRKSSDFKNGNNHSLVIKILFGKSSFLFTGDLQNAGEKEMTDFYTGSTVLQADVWAVSHHGADNGTTKGFLDIVKPSFAVVSCGSPEFGANTNNPFTTFRYGHPRISTLTLLTNAIPGFRTQPAINVKAAKGSKQFQNFLVAKNIYATAWDGNIEIDADDNQHYAVLTRQ